MDIMELGAIREMLGRIGVVAALIYLPVQVRQSNLRRLMRRSGQ